MLLEAGKEEGVLNPVFLWYLIIIVLLFINSSFRAVLADKFKGGSEQNEAMVLGQMLHKVFQATLMRCQAADMTLSGAALLEAINKEVKCSITSLEALDSL